MVDINVADVGSVTSLVSCSVVDNEIIEDDEGGGAPVGDVVGFTVKTVDDIIV